MGKGYHWDEGAFQFPIAVTFLNVVFQCPELPTAQFRACEGIVGIGVESGGICGVECMSGNKLEGSCLYMVSSNLQ